MSITVPGPGFRVKALASRKALVPGAEEFAPSVTGVWLPPERTFCVAGSRAARPLHSRAGGPRADIAGARSGVVRRYRVGARLRAADRQSAHRDLRHAARARGSCPRSLLRGHGRQHRLARLGRGDGTTYPVTCVAGSSTRCQRRSGIPRLICRWRGLFATIPATASERIHDLQTSVEATIPQTATRVYAKYRVNTGFWNGEPDVLMRSSSNARFNIRVHQSLPFLRFSNAVGSAAWTCATCSVKPRPTRRSMTKFSRSARLKRIVGGLQVRF